MDEQLFPTLVKPERGPLMRGPAWIILGLICLAVAVGVAKRHDVVPMVREHLARGGVESHRELILEVAQESGLEPELLAGVMQAESSGRVDALSSAGAMGLFQLVLPTAVERAELLGLPKPTREDLLSNAELNARLGAHYLGYLIERMGSVEAALVAYNTGPTRLSRWIREFGSYAAWRAEREAAGNSDLLAYAEKVLRYAERYRESGLFDAPTDSAAAPGERADQADGNLATGSATDSASGDPVRGVATPKPLSSR